MTTTAPLAPPPVAPAGPTAGEASASPEGPGRLRIDPRVVQKLAACAANEVDGVSQASAAPVGRAIHRPVPASTPPDQLAVDLGLTVSVRYPMPLPVVVERLAVHVAQRVEQLTGRSVRHVGVKVQRLGSPEPGPGGARVR